ncbi:hypothetical protein Tco_0925875 [Tanacetum coccineum]|uniref:Uncharacterized protein n=1 Tax=Tanacetum coccineum TaxID=301880 RepID=A0ABQ5D835_9ASTR
MRHIKALKEANQQAPLIFMKLVEEIRIQKKRSVLELLIQALDSKFIHLSPWITSMSVQPMGELGIANVPTVMSEAPRWTSRKDGMRV